MTTQNLREVLEGEPLTEREIEILYGAAYGETAEETGARIYLAYYTVKHYRKTVVAKMGARNLANAIALGMGSGMLNPDTIMETHEVEIEN